MTIMSTWGLSALLAATADITAHNGSILARLLCFRPKMGGGVDDTVYDGRPRASACLQ